MTAVASKALKAFQDDFVVEAIRANPNDLIRAPQVSVVYSQLLQVAFMIVEPIVAGWKLKMLHSRADALLLDAISLIVSNANKEGRELAYVGVLEACFNRAAERCPSAFNHMEAPDWGIAHQIYDRATAGGDTGLPEYAFTGSSAPGSSPDSSDVASNNQELKESTRRLLEQARDDYGVDELRSTLENTSKLVSFRDLDRATQIAIDTVTKTITRGQSDAIERYCGSAVLTGYVVGRAMLKTAGATFHFSNPLTEADNAEDLIRISTTAAATPYAEALGSAGLLFVQLQQEVANQTGPLSALGKQERDSLAGGSAAAGMLLAIAEHDLHLAD